jgi:hypothetical protein
LRQVLRAKPDPRWGEAGEGASRHWTQKGLAGAPAEAIAVALDTPMNPTVTNAFALAIIASEGPPAFPGLPTHSPDVIKETRSKSASSASASPPQAR